MLCPNSLGMQGLKKETRRKELYSIFVCFSCTMYVTKSIHTWFQNQDQKCSTSFFISPLWFVMMVETLQLFQLVRKLFGMVGIYPPQSHQTMLFNWRNSTFLFCTIAMSIASIAFLLFKAGSAQEFGASFYTTMTELANIFGFLSIVFEMRNIFGIIGKIEGIIEKSKFWGSNGVMLEYSFWSYFRTRWTSLNLRSSWFRFNSRAFSNWQNRN